MSADTRKLLWMAFSSNCINEAPEINVTEIYINIVIASKLRCNSDALMFTVYIFILFTSFKLHYHFRKLSPKLNQTPISDYIDYKLKTNGNLKYYPSLAKRVNW